MLGPRVLRAAHAHLTGALRIPAGTWKRQRRSHSVAPATPPSDPAPVAPSSSQLQPPAADSSDRSDWLIVTAVVVAIAGVITPIALANELETNGDLRAWFIQRAPWVLPALRRFVAIPHDESAEAEAADRPRGDDAVRLWALRASGTVTEHTARADAPLTEAERLLHDGADPVVELFTDERHAQAAASPVAPRLLNAPNHHGAAVADWLVPVSSLRDLGLPCAIGVAASRQALLSQPDLVGSLLDDVRSRLRRSPDLLQRRPLLGGVLLEEEAHLAAAAERAQARVRRADAAIAAAAAARASSLSARVAAHPWWASPFYRTQSRAGASAGDSAPLLLVLTEAEEARVRDRLRRVRLLLGKGP
jgi:hypothetical protein